MPIGWHTKLDAVIKLAFHNTDTNTDILADILARIVARMSVSASWNASLNKRRSSVDC